MSETLEHTAQVIAERGREMLLTRLRPAFAEAAKAHADVIQLDAEQLERMVQQAADRADGLQWRRALAAVATEELGVGLGEALGHPAVVRAHAIAGAPAYEDSLAELGVAPAPAAEKAPAAGPAPATEEATATAEDEDLVHDDTAAAGEEPAGGEGPTVRKAPAPRSSDQPTTGTTRPLRLSAIHLGGVASLAHGERDVELSFSEAGLDILRGPGELLGRLPWARIQALDLPPIRVRRLRRRQPGAHVVIRSADGAASFEIPAVSPEELREQLRPLVERHGIGT